MADIKFNCPYCNQSLDAPGDMFGELIDCPSCKRPIEVRASQPKPIDLQPMRQSPTPHSTPAIIRNSTASPASTVKPKKALVISALGLGTICLMAICSAAFFLISSGAESTLKKMLKTVKKGEDPGIFWIDNAAKQKLYNVIDYEILSSRPLDEVIKPFAGALRKYAEEGINISDKTINEINAKVSDYKYKFPNYSHLGSISMPSNDNIIHNFESLRNAVSSAIPYLSEQERSNLMTLTEKVKTLTGDEDIRSYGAIIDLYIAVGNILIGNGQAKEYIDDAPGLILSESVKLNKYNHINNSLQSIPDGIAYKVKINSTNKAGQPIIWMWTITVINAEGGWKISYMYDEEELTENTDIEELSSAIISITGH